MKTLPISVSLVSALALSVSAAIAQQTEQQSGQQSELSPDELVSQYDSDDNQSLSAEEFDQLYREEVEVSSALEETAEDEDPGAGQASSELFSGLDTDNDGEVDASELGQSISLLSQSGPEGQGGAGGEQAAAEQRSQQSANRPADVEESFATAGEGGNEGESGGAASTAEDFDELAGAPEPRGQEQSTLDGLGEESSPSSRDSEGAIRDGRGPEAGGAAVAGQQAEEAGDAEPAVGDVGQRDGEDLSAGPAQETTLDDLDSENPGEDLAELVRSDPEQLLGATVLSDAGEEVGELEEFVRSTEDGEIYAVIGGGGFLGFGEDKAAVRLEQLRMEDDTVVWTTLSGSAEDALAEQGYDESNYEPLERADESQADVAAVGGDDAA